MLRLARQLCNIMRSEDGATLVEYGLIALLVSIAVIAVLPGVGTAVATIFTRIATALVVP